MIKSLGLVVAAAALCLTTAAQAVDFSLDSVAHNSMGQTRTSKVYMANGKVRVEPSGAPSYELLDTTKPAGWFVIPTKKLYYVQPTKMAQYNIASFSVGATPCAKLAPTGGIITCKKLGTDTLNGRPTEKWQVIQTGPGGTNGQGMSFTSTVWVDRGLDIIVKAQSARGTLQYQNIHIGPQVPGLFAIPAGYTMRQMGQPAQQPASPPAPPQKPH